MWLFTQYGFFSVVMARQVRDGQVTQDVDPDSIMIRTRRRRHLEALLRHFPALGNPEILETHDTDYRYRAVVHRDAFANAAKSIAAEIDYTNFKSACESAMPDDEAYLDALHEVWIVHYGMQGCT